MSEDLIKRSDAIKAVSKVDDYGDGIGFEVRSHCLVELELVPSADIPKKVVAQITFDEEKLREIVKDAVERFKEEYEITDRPQGEWIGVDSYSAFGGSEEQWYAHGNPTAYHYCSVCKEQVHLDEFGEEMLTNFCPNCGARMFAKDTNVPNKKGADDE